MPATTIALDLERTLIDDALSSRPRPGLREFLNFCDENFPRIAIFTTVEEEDAREVLSDLAKQGYLSPSLLARLEFIQWSGHYKDLNFIPHCAPADALLIDDDPGWIRPDQRDQWIEIAPWDGQADTELLRVEAILKRCLAEVDEEQSEAKSPFTPFEKDKPSSMETRIKQLQAWALSEKLLGLADGHYPHPAFKHWCERLRYEKRRQTPNLNLDRVEAREETGNQVSAALWEYDLGDGHAFEVVYCAKANDALEFWHVAYADDTDGPEANRIARSEQGLYYWLFFSLIQSEFHKQGERAYSTLAEAAKSVGFEHLLDVFRLEEGIGSDYERRGELITQSLAIM